MTDLTRRTLIKSAAVLPLVSLPAIWTFQYVTFPSGEWVRDWNARWFEHKTMWRADGKIYGLGARISDVQIADGVAERMVRSYNRVLEFTRRDLGFPVEMIERATRGESGRWIKQSSGWVMY